jgi:hypothetical protein
MQDAAAQSTHLADLLRHAVTALPAAPPRGTAEVWTALWRITVLTVIAYGGCRSALPRGEEVGRRHAFVAAAQAYVEEHLAGPRSVPKPVSRSCRTSGTTPSARPPSPVVLHPVLPVQHRGRTVVDLPAGASNTVMVRT